MNLTIIIYLIIAIMIAIILYLTRFLVPTLSLNDKAITHEIVSWSIIIYGIILGFSISNFYNRYTSIRETLITEVTNLQIIYRIFKTLPDSEEVIESIKVYTINVTKELIISLGREEYLSSTVMLYRDMDNKIINYFNKHPGNPFVNQILSRLSTDQKIKKLVDEIKSGNYYINMLNILLIFIIIPLWFIKLDNSIIQFFMDICLLIIIACALYLLKILNNPFIKRPISFDLNMYSDLLNEINNDY
jgi:hypothetical protein